jgi:toxin ParE1/3/4
LKNIYEFISKESEYYAELTVFKIIDKTELLNNNVNIGKVIKEKQDPLFRELLYKQYRIMYKVLGDQQVNILNIFHSSRNFETNFE